MSNSEVDLIELAASSYGHVPKEDDLEAKKTASEKESSLRSSEESELDIEKGKGGNAGNTSGNGDVENVEKGAGGQEDDQEKTDATKKGNPKDDKGTILNSTAQKILEKHEKPPKKEIR